MQSCTNVSKVHEYVVCGKKFRRAENVLRHQKHAHTQKKLKLRHYFVGFGCNVTGTRA